jgi:4-methyl-5(b-hydroxyethyl)-thiazole monophosphate biosynthesis
MARAVVLLATGFEEIEAVTPVDVLRRADVEVVTAGLGGRRIVGAHGVPFEADTTVADVPDEIDLLVLPGGMPGSENLARSPEVQALVKRVHGAGKKVASICAAPALALSPSGVLDGRKATCYPGFEEKFPSGVTPLEDRVVVDGDLITSRGPGTALEFALTLVRELVSSEKADELQLAMLART